MSCSACLPDRQFSSDSIKNDSGQRILAHQRVFKCPAITEKQPGAVGVHIEAGIGLADIIGDDQVSILLFQLFGCKFVQVAVPL